MILIPKNIASQILRERDKEDFGNGYKYRINRTAPAIIVFCKLKSLSKTGFIKYFENETRTSFLKRIASELGISKYTLEKRLSFLNTKELTNHIEGKYIQLDSWKTLCQMFLVKNEGFIECEELKMETLYKLSFQEKKAEMKKAAVKKYNDLVTKYPNLFDSFTKSIPNANQLDQIQRHVFINGSQFGQNYIDLIWSVNPRLECNSEGYRREFFFKNSVNLYYWLTKLQKAGLIKVIPSEILESKVKGRVKINSGEKSKNLEKFNKKTHKTFLPICMQIQVLETPMK
jgi:Mn-dependent DtxR family transcriptional regulator